MVFISSNVDYHHIQNRPKSARAKCPNFASKVELFSQNLERQYCKRRYNKDDTDYCDAEVGYVMNQCCHIVGKGKNFTVRGKQHLCGTFGSKALIRGGARGEIDILRGIRGIYAMSLVISLNCVCR